MAPVISLSPTDAHQRLGHSSDKQKAEEKGELCSKLGLLSFAHKPQAVIHPGLPGFQSCGPPAWEDCSLLRLVQF